MGDGPTYSGFECFDSYEYFEFKIHKVSVTTNIYDKDLKNSVWTEDFKERAAIDTV